MGGKKTRRENGGSPVEGHLEGRGLLWRGIFVFWDLDSCPASPQRTQIPVSISFLRRVHLLRGACSQLHFSRPSRIFREPGTETDASKSRQRPGNRRTDTAPTGQTKQGLEEGEGRRVEDTPRPLWLWSGKAGLHRCSLGPDKDILPTRTLSKS